MHNSVTTINKSSLGLWALWGEAGCLPWKHGSPGSAGLSDSSLKSQVEDRFHCEKPRASPAVTQYLWHQHTTQGCSDKRRQVWLWQDVLARLERCVVILSLLQIAKHLRRLLSCKAHIKDKTAPKAFCISLRKLSRSATTRRSDAPTDPTQTALGKELHT